MMMLLLLLLMMTSAAREMPDPSGRGQRHMIQHRLSRLGLLPRVHARRRPNDAAPHLLLRGRRGETRLHLRPASGLDGDAPSSPSVIRGLCQPRLPDATGMRVPLLLLLLLEDGRDRPARGVASGTGVLRGLETGETKDRADTAARRGAAQGTIRVLQPPRTGGIDTGMSTRGRAGIATTTARDRQRAQSRLASAA